jgi:heme/copper-type cytochrome/quinol oxidase subunit 3
VVAFAWLGVRTLTTQASAGEDVLDTQAAAVYWHLVDVVWLMLFPVLYLMHP